MASRLWARSSVSWHGVACCFAIAGLVCPSPVVALEFRSVAAPAAVLYDAPSLQGRKVAVLNHGYPVEIVVTLGAWLKVRDATGELAWIEAGRLSNERMVMLRVPRAPVRNAPEDSAPVVFQAELGLLLELIDTLDNWAHVKHRDGLTGYIRITELWGI